MAGKAFYVEQDGRVFVLEKDGRKAFPSSRRQIPFRIVVRRRMAFKGTEVYYCEPKSGSYPARWPLKDDLLFMERVDNDVRKAICYSYVRHVCHAIIIRKGMVLMVKPNRGYTRGQWNLPGGFIHYGESPVEALEREAMEETGLEIEAKRLIGVYTETFENGFYMISFIYLCEALGGREKANPDEIAEIAYMRPDEALGKAESPFVRAGLADYMKGMNKD